ncbi:hypothetical protein F383_34146 [Gossypium arboreum]|uniref:Uncharacterized protein n=1 Tax=Gossypium arboreum TaxID=29729 RepID=A0A0B0N3Y7_GOSAR|nr:hypothetical protein F383_34146 [Gossypium arboreum]
MLRYFQFLFFNFCSSKSTHIARGELSLGSHTVDKDWS